jgi:hypothetical protein
MEIGETVVFVNDVEGIEAGGHGRVMGLCDDTVMVGCRMRERLRCVLVHTWDVLLEPMLVRSDAPEMDLVTVMCRARAYIERGGAEQSKGKAWTR